MVAPVSAAVSKEVELVVSRPVDAVSKEVELVVASPLQAVSKLVEFVVLATPSRGIVAIIC